MRVSSPAVSITTALILYWGAAILSTPGLSIDAAVRYLAFEIFWVFLPGATVLAWLRVPAPGALRWPLAYGVGTGLIVGVAFACGAADQWWMAWCWPIPAVGALLWVRRWRADVVASLTRPTLPALWLMVSAAVLLVFLGVKGWVVLPLGAAPYSYINQDVLWNMGTVLSLERGFPPQDFQAAGMPFGYHYFQNAWLATAHQITHLPLETLVQRTHPLGLLWTLALGVYGCARALGRSRAQAALASGLSVLFVRGEFNSLASALFYETGGFAFSLIGFLGAWQLMPWALRRWSTIRLAALPLLLLAFSAAGAKIVVPPLLLTGLALSGVLMRRSPDLTRRLLAVAGLILVATAVAYAATLSGIRSGGLLELFPFYTLREQRWAEFAWAHTFPFPVVAGLYLLVQYWPTAALGWLTVDRLTSARGRALRLAAILVVIGGIAGSATFGHVGSSHLYFEYLGMLMVPFLVATVRTRTRAVPTVTGWVVTVAALAIVGVLAHRDLRHAALSWQGTRNTPAADFADDSVSRLQLEALAYLREQTPVDAVVMANRRQTWPGYYRYYYNTAISERRAFLAGPDYSPFGNLSRLYNRLGIPPVRTAYYQAMEDRVIDTHYFFAATSLEDATTRLCRHPLITHVLLDLQVQPALAFAPETLLTERFRNAHAVVYQVTGCGAAR